MVDQWGNSEISREQKELYGQIKKVHGDIPKGISKVLEYIIHPDVIQWTEDWLKSASLEVYLKEDEEDWLGRY